VRNHSLLLFVRLLCPLIVIALEEEPVGIIPVSNTLPLFVSDGPKPDVAVCGAVSSFLHTRVLPLENRFFDVQPKG
jgi:hypothetical protein